MNSESKVDFYEGSKKCIIDNWDIINENINVMNDNKRKIKEIEKLTNNEYKIIIKIENENKKLILKNKFDLRTFNAILNPKEILYYINKYKIKNPVYFLNNNYYYINSSNIEQIFKTKEINDIMDSNMEDILQKNKYHEFLMKDSDKVINLYINDKISDI